MSDSEDKVFDRERTAYRLVAGRIEDFLSKGYDLRIHDQPVLNTFECVFVGPANPGEHSHVETLKLPFQLMALLMYDEPNTALSWRALLDQRATIDAQLYALIKDLMERKLKGRPHDDSSTGERHGESEKEND